MNFDKTESNILIIARALEAGASINYIVATYEQVGFDSDNIFLLVKAAEQLVAARRDAPIHKPLFKRIP